ncbi:hypothetical protein OQA88_5936 [Cercophora sp. LCS_1]
MASSSPSPSALLSYSSPSLSSSPPLVSSQLHISPSPEAAPIHSSAAACHCPAESDLISQFSLVSLTVLPIPKIQGISSAINTHAEERRAQLFEKNSTQEILIYYGATTAHIDAINRDGISPGRITFFGDPGSGKDSGLLFFRMPQPIHETAHGFLYRHLQILINGMGLNRSNWVVKGAPMVIPFEDVFLRSPRQQETDLILSSTFFLDMGMQCWQSHTNIKVQSERIIIQPSRLEQQTLARICGLNIYTN